MSDQEKSPELVSHTVIVAKDAAGETAPERRLEDLPPAAQRALKEAEERRKAAKPLDLAKEYNGRDGPEPVRFGDWENKGITSDF